MLVDLIPWLNAFKKIGVVLARQDMLGFLRHREILKCINPFTPDGVMTSTNFYGNIFFTVSESDALQAFMASSNITLNTSIEVLCRLPIFRSLQHGNDSLFSINKENITIKNCVLVITPSGVKGLIHFKISLCLRNPKHILSGKHHSNLLEGI